MAAIRTTRRPWLILAAAVLAAFLLPVAWYLGSPLFLNMTVQENFPTPAQGMAEQPVPLGSGQFGVVDAIHRGQGQAAIYRLPDGSRVLRFEDFQVTNGPDLFVYLSGHPAPRDSGQLHQGAAVEVGRLKGNQGSQNYELPAHLDLASIKSVVIYCKQFSVVFSTAELMAS